jgi:tRNA pseudouridine55 synthase
VQKLGIKKLKVGHAGTLDPKATGLVVLCTGKATKTIDTIQADQKEYVATLKLGATTPSFDLESEEDMRSMKPTISPKNLISKALKVFIGEIDQSAAYFFCHKSNGKRAFNYARGGHELEMKARKVLIESISIDNIDMPLLTLKIVCGKGTYIRSLANDIGLKLDSGAYLVGLRRTRIGNHKLDQAPGALRSLKNSQARM